MKNYEFSLLSTFKNTKKKRKNTLRYTKSINIKFTTQQWKEVIKWAEKARLDPSIYIRRIILEFLNIKDSQN